MLILILIDVQYSQKAIFSFEKGAIGQITPPQVPTLPGTKIPPAKFLIPLH